MNGEIGAGAKLPGRPPLRVAAEALGPSIVLAGLILFVLVRTYYGIFFGALEIDPADVGLDYASTLVSAVGLLLYVVLAGVAYPIFLACAGYVLWQLRHAKGQSFSALTRSSIAGLRGWLPGALRRVIPLAVVLATFALAWLLLAKASAYADAVQAGKPIKFGSPLVTTFGVRASPVRLEPAPGAQLDTATSALIKRADAEPGLLYIGRNDSSLTFYDAKLQRSVSLPGDNLILEVINCDAPRPDASRCARAVG